MRFPVEHPDEMGSIARECGRPLLAPRQLRARLRAGLPAATRGSRRATSPRRSAAYERTLVSPPTRFDKWVAGDARRALAVGGQRLRIFAGKGRCINCHTGFAFTDHNFYDIGLPSEDKGRGTEIDLRAADHAFKVPTLRELAWTAPYMHDGSHRHARRRRAHLRDGRRRAPDAQPGTCRDEPALTDAGARRPDRLPRVPVERDAAAALDASLGRNAAEPPRPHAARRHHGRQPGQQAVLAAHVRLGPARR